MATATTPLRSRDHVGNLAASLYDIQKDDFRGSMLPIRRLTRRDIEDQLNHDFTDADNWKLHHDQSIAACVPVETAANRNHRILRTYSIGPLFSQPQRPDSTHQHQQPPAPMLLPPPSLSALRSRDPLKLTPYLSQPLYGDEIYSAPPELFSITLDPDDYASKRRKIILHMETVRQKQDYVSGSTLARSSGTGNREQDTIDDSGAKTDAALLSQQQTATTTKSSLASTPIPQSTVSANSSGQTVTATTEDDDDDATTITATSSRSSVLSPPRPLLRPSYPTGWVPICPTDFQQTKCDELRRAAEQDTSEYKPLFLDTIGALNHPLVAMMDDYGVTEADKWGGSGKTQFLHDFITSLCELNKVYNPLRSEGIQFFTFVQVGKLLITESASRHSRWQSLHMTLTMKVSSSTKSGAIWDSRVCVLARCWMTIGSENTVLCS
ncbi:hypothetical protein BX666DRAFT_548493 [Dichotomocladium elegans]|nr:hypothetical protein BX666DRAFT_548493 [Dichotomocladium elegans]